ncbi:MAG: hypothetical protein WA005_19950 [Candidatus Binataceae bacterium]
MMLGLSREQRAEYFDNAINQVNDLVQRWNHRLTLENLTLAKRYVEGHLRILIQFRRLERDDPAGEFCAIFQRKDTPGSGHAEVENPLSNFHKGLEFRNGDVHVGERKTRIYENIPGRDACCYERAVFICDAEAVEIPERCVPSLVRLERSDETHRFIAGTLYFSQQSGFKFLDAIENRKARLVGNGPTVRLNQFTGKVVKARTEAVDRVCGDNGEPERRFFQNPGFGDFLAGLWICIDKDRIYFAVKESPDLGVEITDVLFGPFDLCNDWSDAV